MPPPSGKTPRWMQRLIDRVITSMTPFETSGDIKWYWHEPETPDKPWEIFCFPTEVERWGGPKDGACYTAGYTLCLTELLKLFRVGHHVHWLSRTKRGPGEFGGPCIQIDGRVGDKAVLLHCFTFAPREVGATVRLNCYDGTVSKRPGKEKES